MNSQALKGWLPVVLRGVAVLATFGPALMKIIDYPGQVEFFRSLGIPAPEIMVILSGGAEVIAIILLVLGAAGRVAALMLLSVVTVAIITAGPNVASVLVALSTIGILILGTGRYSLWTPEERLLRRKDDSQAGL
ncbi:MAG: hypothetical protein Kow00124_04340 [Anaerolineae bacterium]